MSTPNTDHEARGVSEETEKKTSAYPAISYLLKALSGTPAERAHIAGRVIQEYLLGKDETVTRGARAALESFCAAHNLQVADYLQPAQFQVETSIPVTSSVMS